MRELYAKLIFFLKRVKNALKTNLNVQNIRAKINKKLEGIIL